MEILKTALLVTYFTILSVLSIYGVHRLWMLFLWLFCSGFGYISLMSLTDVKVLRGLAMPELDDEKPAPLLLG